MTNCRRCGKPANKPVVVEQTISDKGRSFVKRTTIPLEYRCECGNREYSGTLALEETDVKNPFILNKFPTPFGSGKVVED